MFQHDAEYFRCRRRAHGIPERERLSARELRQTGIRLKGLEQLPWPRNLLASMRAWPNYG